MAPTSRDNGNRQSASKQPKNPAAGELESRSVGSGVGNKGNDGSYDTDLPHVDEVELHDTLTRPGQYEEEKSGLGKATEYAKSTASKLAGAVTGLYGQKETEEPREDEFEVDSSYDSKEVAQVLYNLGRVDEELPDGHENVAEYMEDNDMGYDDLMKIVDGAEPDEELDFEAYERNTQGIAGIR